MAATAIRKSRVTKRFPLTARGDGRWCKKYKGRMYYFRGSAERAIEQWNALLANLTTAEAKHVVMRRLSDLEPSPENLDIYQPVTPESVADLVSQIRTDGVLEPLVITLDDYLLSGHRRRVAARLAGLNEVPVRIHPIRRTDDIDAFVRLLIAHNSQRVKTFAEKLHEEASKIDPAQAYRRLIAERVERSSLPTATLHLGARRRRSKISSAKQPFLDAVLEILRNLKKPVSDRKLHYEVGSMSPTPLRHAKKRGSRYKFDRRSYNDLCNLLTRARIQGIIPWEWICDDTRQATNWTVWPDTQPFVRNQLRSLFTGYYRDLLVSQPNYIAVHAEKNTVAAQVESLCSTYCVPLTSGRGFCSSRPRYDLAQRFLKSGKSKLVLLIISDLDPAGMAIAESFARSMRDDFDIDEIHATKVAITIEQVRRYKLPHGEKAKEGRGEQDGLRREFVRRYGEYVYEVEALPAGELQSVLDNAIRSVLDIGAYNNEVDAESRDAKLIEATRYAARSLLKGIDPDLEGDDEESDGDE